MDIGGIFGLIIVVAIIVGVFVLRNRMFEIRRKQRREYYREYLQSEEWKRKRYVVLKRDNWRCVYCGAPATEVHHLKYAKYNIGKEPIDWLVSVCKNCHKSEHH
jgi:5-methylcytosine-specific restriction endonuclease McrA